MNSTNGSNIESGIQLFSRLNRKTFLEGIHPNFFNDNGPLPNQVIEITGDQKVDKSDLLIDFIAKCILPSMYHKEWKTSGAVVIICEHQINLFKIIKVMETHLKQNRILDPGKKIIESCLKNLTIYNCYSPEELEISILSLESLILSKDVSLVVVDNMNSYYWIAKQDCCTLSYYQHSLKNFQTIFNVVKTLNILLIYCRTDKTNSSKKGFQNLDYRINVEEEESGYIKANVTDFAKQTTVTVRYKLDVILHFL